MPLIQSGGNLQAELDKALPGDVLELAVGERFVGNYVLPPKSGLVTLRSAGILPEQRIATDQPGLATIASPNGDPPISGVGAANWALVGFRAEPVPGGFGDVIRLHGAEHITIDRMLLEVSDGQQQKNGIVGNGKHITLTRSHLSGIWRDGQESHGFIAWDGAGPYRIEDTFIEAAGINLMFGGADSSSPENMPSDAVVRNCHFFKRLAWKAEGSVGKAVKNLVEVKAGRRMQFVNCLLENNWADGQSGRAIVLTPRNQDGNAPWSVVEDIDFDDCTLRNTPTIAMVSGYDNINPSGQTKRVRFRNCDFQAENGFLALGEVGSLEISNCRLTTNGWYLYISHEGDIAIPNGSRQPAYAVMDLALFANQTTGNIHGPEGADEAALKLYTKRYSMTGPLVEEPGTPPPPPPPPPDPAIEQLTAKVSTLEAADAAQKQKLDALALYLSKLPSNAKVQDVVRYLQRIPK